MAIDGVTLNSTIKELQMLVGAKISKIYVPKKDETILVLKKERDTLKLDICISANDSRMHLTDSSKENPLAAPPFCMVLRKYLLNGRIMGIEQIAFERIAVISILSADEMGELKQYKLYIELMGRHSNIILCDDSDKILDSIKHVPLSISRMRQILPSLTYVMPPSQGKYSLSEISDVSLEEIIKSGAGSLSKCILNTFEGLSPTLARETAYRACSNEDIDINTLNKSEIAHITERIMDVFNKIKNGDYEPHILYNTEKKPINILPFLFKSYDASLQRPQKSMNEALDLFYTTKETLSLLNSKKTALRQKVKVYLNKCEKRLAIQLQTLLDANKMDKYSLYGELITSNIYALKRGMKNATLLNYYTGEQVEITLDDRLSPSANAQKYYKRYNKLKIAQEYASKEKSVLEKEIAYLESILEALDRCENVEDVQEIRQELIRGGYIKEQRKSKKVHREQSHPLRYTASDDTVIYAGKNNKQNDMLTLKIAENEDTWLHTKDIHGSHVIIKSNKNDPSETTLYEAACIAAYNSKARHSQNVPVDYTRVQYVKKPSGAKPGMVIYTHQKTLFVTPDEELIDKLLYK